MTVAGSDLRRVESDRLHPVRAPTNATETRVAVHRVFTESRV